MNHQYFDLLKSKIESGLIMSSKDLNNQSSGTPNAHSSSSPVKYSIKEAQEKIKLFLINAKIFERAIKTFTGKLVLFLNYSVFEFIF